MPKRRQLNPTKLPTLNEADSATSDESHSLDFFAQVQQLSPEDWQHGYKVYLYRIWPVIDKRDEQHYLAKLNESFDEDMVLRNWGSGKYLLKLNNGRGETVTSRTVSLHNQAFPPKVSPDEVVESDPRNKTYFKVWPIGSQATTAPADTTAMHELTKLAAKVIEQRETGGSPSATVTAANPLNDLKTLAEVVKTLQPPAEKVELVTILRDEMTDLRKQLAEDRAEQRRLQQELFQAKTATAAAGDPIDAVTKLWNAASRIRDVIPEREAVPVSDGANGWLTFLSGPAGSALINQVAAPLTSLLMQVVMKRVNGSEPAEAPTPAPATGQSAVPPDGGLPQHPASPASQPAAAAGQPTLPANLAGLVNQISPVMLRWMQTDSPGEELGRDLAEYAWEHSSLEDVQALQQLGTDTIVELYRRSPVWYVLSTQETKFRRLVHAFVQWQEPDEENGPLDGGEPGMVDLTELP